MNETLRQPVALGILANEARLCANSYGHGTVLHEAYTRLWIDLESVKAILHEQEANPHVKPEVQENGK